MRGNLQEYLRVGEVQTKVVTLSCLAFLIVAQLSVSRRLQGVLSCFVSAGHQNLLSVFYSPDLDS